MRTAALSAVQYAGPFNDTLLSGCVDGCRTFNSLRAAQSHCEFLTGCGGVMMLSPTLFQVRLKEMMQTPTEEMMQTLSNPPAKSHLPDSATLFSLTRPRSSL